MGLTELFKKVSGLVKQRAATATGALRRVVSRVRRRLPTARAAARRVRREARRGARAAARVARRGARAARAAARGVSVVPGARVVRGVKFAARGARLTTPVGIGLTALTFAPEIIKGARRAIPFIRRVGVKALAFLGGKGLATAAVTAGAAGAVVGIVSNQNPNQNVPRPGLDDSTTPGAPSAPSVPGESTAPPGTGILPGAAPNGGGIILPGAPRPTTRRPITAAKRRTARRKARKVTPRRRISKAARRRRRKAVKVSRRKAHKATISRDIVHKPGKRGISLKAIRASIASPNTPPQLKKGLRKLLKKRVAHEHKR